MQERDNRYLDLTTYTEIYRELVYQRNAAISWLEENKLMVRDRRIAKENEKELLWQKSAAAFRYVFSEDVLDVFNRLYSHDAVEAIYDFKSIDLADWSDTEVNRLERELQALQGVISKLEVRYGLQYKLIFDYDTGQCVLFSNRIEVLSCGQTTLRHRLLSTLFSDTHKHWANSDIADFFHTHFGYEPEELKDKAIEKAANDLRKDIAAKTAIKDFLIVSNATVSLNQAYVS